MRSTGVDANPSTSSCLAAAIAATMTCAARNLAARFSLAPSGRFSERLRMGAPPRGLAAQERNVAPAWRRADRSRVSFHPLGALFQFPRPRQIRLSQALIGHRRAPLRTDAKRPSNAGSFTRERLPICSTICFKFERSKRLPAILSAMVDKS
jgi:hypothetical protein